ncbi:MAG TPA: DUF1648 domain-containing protein [Candidatus Krumholzibacteria bacterium]|nr:DUF1648 domain-containing protein [Candidatus Krumholzibacteria bacterium]
MNDVFSPFARGCALVAIAATLFHFAWIAMRYPTLPERIPRHFGLLGKPDRWGNKRLIWLNPAVALGMVVALGFVARSSVARASGTGAEDARQVSIVAAYVSLIMLVVSLRTVAVAEKRADGMGRLMVPVLFAATALLVLLMR